MLPLSSLIKESALIFPCFLAFRFAFVFQFLYLHAKTSDPMCKLMWINVNDLIIH